MSQFNLKFNMPKLHEVLAANGALDTQATKCRQDLANTFEKKRHLFEEKRSTFTPNGEGHQMKVEAQSDIQSTVKKELAWIKAHLAKAFDTSYQIAETNTLARADVLLEDEAGTILLKNIPATALLELEKRVAELHELLKAVPTLDPAKGFRADADRGEGIYVAREVIKTRTQKTPKVIVKYDATKEHPAQTELLTVDEPVGTLTEQEWSALITPAEKAALLDRAEALIRSLKRARSRANDTEVDTSQKIAAKLLGYVLEGKA